MKKSALIFLLVFAGAINLSTSKSEMILGRWEILKLVSRGEKQNKRNEDEKRWLEFRENNIMVAGRGEKADGKREKWIYEDDKKKLFITERNDQIEFEVVKLSNSKMVLKTNAKGKLTKIYFKKMKI